jgi:hypothetical protein
MDFESPHCNETGRNFTVMERLFLFILNRAAGRRACRHGTATWSIAFAENRFPLFGAML